jgi:hypothetical protein
MECRKAKMLINEYLDGTLDTAKIRGLLSHINICSECSAELKEIKALKNLLNNLPQEEAPEGLLSGALKKARQHAGVQKRNSFNYKRYAAIAAALVITIGAAWYFNTGLSNMGNAAPSDEVRMFAADMAPAASSSAPAASSSAAASSAPVAAAAPMLSQAPADSMTGEAVQKTEVARSSPPVEGNGEKQIQTQASCEKTALPVIEIAFDKAQEDSFIADFTLLAKENKIVYEQAQDGSTMSFVLEEAVKPAFLEILIKYGLFETALPSAFPATIHIAFINK